MKNFENMKKDAKEFFGGFKNMFNDLKTKGRRHKQIPNLITLSRVGLACFIPPFALAGNLIAATIVTVLAAITDGIDGLVARKLNATSEFGKNLDPVCDKIFAGTLLLPLIIKSAPILTIGLSLSLGLELGISGVNLKSKAKGNMPRTTILGKIKTGLLSILLASLYASFSYQAIVQMIPLIYTLTITTQAIALANYYQIDKKKDIRKNKLELFNEYIDDTEIAEKKIEKNDKIIENSKQYSSEDFKNLKVEVLRTHSISNEESTLINSQGFQKIK